MLSVCYALRHVAHYAIYYYTTLYQGTRLLAIALTERPYAPLFRYFEVYDLFVGRLLNAYVAQYCSLVPLQ